MLRVPSGNITTNAPLAAKATPRVLVVRSILSLNPGILASLMAKHGLVEHGGRKELEAFRTAWLEWMVNKPQGVFFGYADAFHQFVSDSFQGSA